jgi:nicotinate phosphoribosyltransferase
MNNLSATYTDKYQLTMAEVYFLEQRHEHTAVFDYFFRKPPFKGSYALFAGLENVLEILENLRFTDSDIDFLHKDGLNSSFLDYLKNFTFKGKIYSMKEGEIVFPTEPVLRVEANIAEAQIIETLLLNILNFQTLIATKASRMRYVAGERRLIDFGLRRAQAEGAYFGARAAYIGGFDATSNVVAGKDFDIPVSGTMAHSFIQSYDDELTAFRRFAENRPDDCVLLVDTYDTLKSGLPNAIKTGKEMEARGHKLKGIRLDSGDLAYLSREARKMLDDEGLDYVKIAASNQLDEHLIKSLNEQGAKIDVFGVGTNLMTGQPDAALDGVFKLASYDNEARIKLSDSTAKITLPDRKKVMRLMQNDNMFLGADVIMLEDEESTNTMHHPFEALKKMDIQSCKKEKLHVKVMENGKRSEPKKSASEIREYAQARLKQLPEEHKRFEYPHIYKVGLSDALNEERNRLIDLHKSK